MERPSQKLIAKKLGISTSAVSLALRDTGSVSKELTIKVKEMAKAVGYRPNPTLSSLASKHFRDSSVTQGVPVAVLEFLDNPTLYSDALRTRAEELGYSLLFITKKELSTYNNPSTTLRNRGVQGIIIIGPVPQTAFRSDFDWDKFAVVQCGRFLEPLEFDTVRPNIFQGIKLTYHKVKQQGYQRIGFALGHHSPLMEDDESRLSAVLGLQQIETPAKRRIPPYFGKLEDTPRLIKWARQYKPDCIIGFHIGQCSDLIRAGIRVPEDVGFACLHMVGPFTLQGERTLSIAGADQNMQEIAYQSMNIIDQSIRYHISGLPKLPRHLLIPSTWIEADSLPKQV